MSCPSIVILNGGVSSEREVSLRTGKAVTEALSSNFEVQTIELKTETLPRSIRADKSIVFPALHGSFGEDGRLQALLEAASIHYCGSDAVSSRLCMDKAESKEIARVLNIATPESITFDAANVPIADEVISKLGSSLVIKRWLIEERIRGRELTVGVLNGKAMGIVEIRSQSGIYDYAAKYSIGAAEYLFPAELDSVIATSIKEEAEQLFNACGCRDFARVDFLLDDHTSYFLEINTLPGMTKTSLLPKSALCQGHDFEQLAIELVAPAIARFKSASIK